MRKIVVILYGLPGSGKGTQANILADKLGLIHFDSGKFFESVVHDQARQSEKIIKRERKFFDNGQLMTPSFVLREVSKEAKKIKNAGWGIVFSGSLRTLFEAERLYPILEKLYGKKSIFIFLLKVQPEDSMRRNSARLVCTVCGYTLLSAYYPHNGSTPLTINKPKHCPVCAGAFYRRTLDKPKVIKIRLEEYKNRTKPILELVKKRGYRVREIDARPAPYKVFKNIYGYLKNAS